MKSKQKEIDANLSTIANTSAIVFLLLILSKIITYGYRVIIARHFGPEEYGLFSLALIVFSFVATFSSLGLFDGLLRFISIYRGKKEINKINYVFRVALAILLISSIICMVLLYFSADWISLKIFHNEGLIIYLKIFSIMLPLNAVSGAFLYILKSYERADWHSFIVNVIQNVVKVSTLILLIVIGLKSQAIILSYFLGALSVGIFAYIICKYKLPEVFLKPKLSSHEKDLVFGNLVFYSWPIIFLGMFTNLLFWTDSFVIGYFKSAADVGLYNSVITTISLFGLAQEIFLQMLFPMINRAYSKNKLKVVEELSKQVAKWILIVNLPLFLMVISFPWAILNVLFGEEYIVAGSILRILSIASLFTSINVSSNLLLMIGKSKLVMKNTIFIAVLNLVLDIILVQRYGMTGAAFATLISLILLGFLFIIQAKIYTRILPLRRSIIKIFFISLVPLILINIIRNFVDTNFLNLFWMGLVFLLVYSVLIYLTGCLDKNEFFILNNFKKKISEILSKGKNDD